LQFNTHTQTRKRANAQTQTQNPTTSQKTTQKKDQEYTSNTINDAATENGWQLEIS
jgi:hypothetical protein